jgi:hypothetical protein
VVVYLKFWFVVSIR